MTETPTTTPKLDPVLPEGVDPLDDLTVGELGTVGKLLKADPYAAVQDAGLGLRWPALAHIAWVWKKRTEPTAKLQPLLDLRPAELVQLLRLDDDETPLGDSDTDDRAGEAEENPTD